jgi:hypothetical protein
MEESIMESKLGRVFIGWVVVSIALYLTGGMLIHPAWAQTTQTVTLISGNGAIGTLDPLNQFSVDGGATWQQAWIVTALSVYGKIPGAEYIFCGSTVFNPCGVRGSGISTLYRTTFTLPAGAANPSLVVNVHADNAAIIYLNGVEIGRHSCWGTFSCTGAEFSEPPETFSTSVSSLFQVGANILSFDLWDFGFAAGLDYQATVSFTSVLQVDIDIKPGSFPNSINPDSGGVIPVTILTTEAFDATTVDLGTVLFGATGSEAAPVHSAFEDVDGDGDTDIILQFGTESTRIHCGDTFASLTGRMISGQAIGRSDSIRTVGCK